MTPEIRVCTYCVMDTTDPEITFDEAGRCHHCRRAEAMLKTEPHSLSRQEKERCLLAMAEEIKRAGRGKPHDCILGVSGGVDSTYTAYMAKKLGLRPLAVHLDNGWDSKLAVTNIERTLQKLDIELYT